MKDMHKRRLFFAIIILLVISYGVITTNLGRYAVPLSAFSDPLERDHGLFEVELCPYGYTAVCLITIDDVSYHTDVLDLSRLLALLEWHEAHATFFVIPAHGSEEKDIALNEVLAERLGNAIAAGCEVGQHGYTHTPARELKGMSADEERTALARGRELLECVFGPIVGFRAPSYWATATTYHTLSEMGYAYCAPASLFNVFPFHPTSGRLPGWGDPLSILCIPGFPEDDVALALGEGGVEEALYHLNARFDACREKGTPYVLTTHMPIFEHGPDGSAPCQRALSRFLDGIDDGTVWFPSMQEYAEWYEMITELRIDSTFIEGLMTISVYSSTNPSGLTFILHDLDDITDVIVYVNGEVAEQDWSKGQEAVIII